MDRTIWSIRYGPYHTGHMIWTIWHGPYDIENLLKWILKKHSTYKSNKNWRWIRRPNTFGGSPCGPKSYRKWFLFSKLTFCRCYIDNFKSNKACLHQVSGDLRWLLKHYDSDDAQISNTIPHLLDLVESLCVLENDKWAIVKRPLQAELMQRVLMYMCGEYIFTGKNDIKSIISVRDPRTIRSGPESLSTKYETWFLESLKKLVPKLVTGWITQIQHYRFIKHVRLSHHQLFWMMNKRGSLRLLLII